MNIMTKRDRPRMNLTLAPEVKEEIRSISKGMGVSVSRLIEEILREFMQTCEGDPMIARRISKKIEDRKRQKDEDGETSETIRNILERMEQFE